ncbi:MAG: hypothetical protein ACSNEK_09950 [Parachlamydiaceae bacterium]
MNVPTDFPSFVNATVPQISSSPQTQLPSEFNTRQKKSLITRINDDLQLLESLPENSTEATAVILALKKDYDLLNRLPEYCDKRSHDHLRKRCIEAILSNLAAKAVYASTHVTPTAHEGSYANPIYVADSQERRSGCSSRAQGWEQYQFAFDQKTLKDLPIGPEKQRKKREHRPNIPAHARKNKDNVYEVFSGLARPKREEILTIKEGLLVVSHCQHGEYQAHYRNQNPRLLRRAIANTVICIDNLKQCKLDWPAYEKELENIITGDRQRLDFLREELAKIEAKQSGLCQNKGSIHFVLN